MITFFNHFSKNWGAKIILSLLTLSMIVVWGLGGFLNTNLFTGEVITVGNRSVTAPELVKSFNEVKQNLSNMTGHSLTNKEAMELQLVDQVVQQKIMENVQELMQSDLGTNASNASVRKYVEHHPAFQDNLGNFDKNLFYAFLSQSRMSESELAKKLEKELAFQHVANTVRALGYAPQKLVKLAYQYQNEKRNVSYLILDPKKIALTEKPTQAELQDYYDAYADEFMLPEYRTVSVLALTPDVMLDKVVVTDEEVNDAYDEKKVYFMTPEKRQVWQILFDDEAKATAAAKNMTADNFMEVAKQNGQTAEQTNFGLVTKDELMLDLAEPVFKAARNQVIGPVATSLGWHVLMVRDIKSAVAPDEKKIRADIKKQLAGEKTYDAMYEMSKKLEDILGGGDSLAWAAEELKLPIKKMTVDMSGHLKNGQEMPKNMQNPMLLQEIFTTSVGNATSVIEQGDGFLLASVDDIIPASQKTFDSVKNEVNALWRAEKQKEKLADVSEKMLARIQSGAELGTLGTFGNFTVKNVSDLMRKSPDLPAATINQIFGQGIGAAKATLIPQNDGFVIAVVKNARVPDTEKDKIGLGVVAENLKMATGNLLMDDMLSAYADEFGVQINHNEIKKAFAPYMEEEDSE